MRRLVAIGIVGLIVVVSALVYMQMIADPPPPAIERATPENTHGHTPAQPAPARVG